MSKYFESGHLEKFLANYTKIVSFVVNDFEIRGDHVCDHIGCLVHNSSEFNLVNSELLRFSKSIKEIVLDNRRAAVFKFNNPIETAYTVPKIEIFEPKPNIDQKALRFGIEHISFYAPDWEEFYALNRSRLPIVKEGYVGNSKFMKTEIINTIEIEFRSDKLGEENL